MIKRTTLTESHLRKAGARLARTGSGYTVARTWCRSNRLTHQQSEVVMKGYRDESTRNPFHLPGLPLA